jgi:uncharacterized protein
MRRKEKEIVLESDKEAVIFQARICRLGLCDEGQPYIVPLCFGYSERTLYFHGAQEGRKLEIIRKNPRVCFEFDVNTEIVQAEQGCRWGMKYQSIVGFGRAVLIDRLDEKRIALAIIMRRYSERQFQFPETEISRTAVIKVEIESMTGKQAL